MKILLLRDSHLINLSIDDSSKEFDVIENDSYTIVIYGYPYFCHKDNWVKAKDIENYLRSGKDNFIYEVDGIYTIIYFDKTSESFTLITDRYGIYTPYYSMFQDKLTIADKLEYFIENSTEMNVDRTSVIEYLNFGYKLGDKTHLKRVKKLEGATIYTISNKLEIKTKKYWDLFDVKENEKLSNEEFLEVFNEHFRKALALEDKITLPLTGGRDSRAILSACLEKKDKLHCYTHGPSYHHDVKQAKLISKHFGIKHKHYRVNDTYGERLDEKARNNSGILNGHFSFFDYLHVKDLLEEEDKYGELFITGILGNQLYRHHPIGENIPESNNIKDIASFIVRRLPSAFYFRSNFFDFYGQVFNGFDTPSLYNLLVNSVNEVLIKATKAERQLDYTRYYLFDSYCSNVANNSLRLTGKYFKVYGAFFHKDLLKQFKFMKINELVTASMHNYIIGKNNKYLSELTYYGTERVIKYIKLISNKISIKLINKQLFKHPDIANFHYWLKKYNKPFLLNLLDFKKMLSAPLFNADGLNKIIDIYIHNKAFDSKKKILLGFSIERFIMNLISLELWLKEIGTGKKISFS